MVLVFGSAKKSIWRSHLGSSVHLSLIFFLRFVDLIDLSKETISRFINKENNWCLHTMLHASWTSHRYSRSLSWPDASHAVRLCVWLRGERSVVVFLNSGWLRSADQTCRLGRRSCTTQPQGVPACVSADKLAHFLLKQWQLLCNVNKLLIIWSWFGISPPSTLCKTTGSLFEPIRFCCCCLISLKLFK